MLNDLELTGRARTHVVQCDDLGAAIHPEALVAFLEMKDEAFKDGIELGIASSFRDFDAQLRIWNMKYRGERPLYDSAGNTLDYGRLSPIEIVDSILCWSALPGASRHHWGSDIDVIDRAAIDAGYRVRLLPDEYAQGGVFHRLNEWLQHRAVEFGYFRPYAAYRGGFFPEPWHLSFAQISTPALDLLTEDLVAAAVSEGGVLGGEFIAGRLPEIFKRYVRNISVPGDPAGEGAR